MALLKETVPETGWWVPSAEIMSPAMDRPDCRRVARTELQSSALASARQGARVAEPVQEPVSVEFTGSGVVEVEHPLAMRRTIRRGPTDQAGGRNPNPLMLSGSNDRSSVNFATFYYGGS